jgi:DNA ligase-1
MLAPNDDPLKRPDFFQKLRFPLLCSPKLDGIRNVTRDERCKSRKLIDLPNKQIQRLLSPFQDLDGELIIGNETDFGVYNRTQSFVMSIDKEVDEAEIKYRVFDVCAEEVADAPFKERFQLAGELIQEYGHPNITLVSHFMCNDLEELLEGEALCLELGYEGIMMRDPFGRYKHGRGTFNEGLIYKLKRFADDEGLLVGIEEQLKNTNEKQEDNLGHSKRATHKEFMVAAGTLGKLLVDYDGMLLAVAPGCLTHAQRQAIWNAPEKFIGETIKFRHFAHGVKDKPRFPRFVGFRNNIDL